MDLEKRAKVLPEDDENAHEEFARVLLDLTKLMTQRAREERRVSTPVAPMIFGGPSVDRLAAAIERSNDLKEAEVLPTNEKRKFCSCAEGLNQSDINSKTKDGRQIDATQLISLNNERGFFYETNGNPLEVLSLPAHPSLIVRGIQYHVRHFVHRHVFKRGDSV